jgi:hypothetical protein
MRGVGGAISAVSWLRGFVPLAPLDPSTTSAKSIAGFALLLLGACAAPSPPPVSSPEPHYELVIGGVVDSALEELLTRMRRLPAFAPAPKPDVQGADSARGTKGAVVPSRVVIAVDRSVGKVGQRTAASQLLDSVLLQAARQKLIQFDVVEVSPAILSRVQYILAGKLSPLDAAMTSREAYRVDLVLSDFRTSHIVAQCSVQFEARGVDLAPSATAVTP